MKKIIITFNLFDMRENSMRTKNDPVHPIFFRRFEHYNLKLSQLLKDYRQFGNMQQSLL